MKNLINMEIINISTKNGKLIALMSYQDLNHDISDVNIGYDTIEVPINLRDIQLSSRDNMLVNQSLSASEDVCVGN